MLLSIFIVSKVQLGKQKTAVSKLQSVYIPALIPALPSPPSEQPAVFMDMT